MLWTDLNFDLRQLTVKDSKSGDPRHVPMNEVVIQTLQSLPKVSEYVFPGLNAGKPLVNGIKNSDWKKYLRQANIVDFCLHDLRHTFASRLVMAGVDLYTVSKLLGHHGLAVTERYAHLFPDFLKRAVDSLTSSASNKPTFVVPKAIVAAEVAVKISPELTPYAPVAQLDRASDFESAGRPFESGRAHHLFNNLQASPFR